ncbi:type IV secretion system protein [Francisella sp. TX07-6608]|uniref:type IV secretion system protein n=1 Tax=Francisella sp. TX07-6608 TaxID=573568 RepID=UPI0008F9B9B8|nr:type IV secretion system protein [Francisella sp. TX07-6608]OIN82938.1 virB8 family protein [Francisella sp. TX07-6608]
MAKFEINDQEQINKVKSASDSIESSQNHETDDNPDVTEIAGHTFLKEINTLKQQNSFFKKIILILLVIIILAVGLLGYIGSKSKVDLAVIHTSGNNQIISVSRSHHIDHSINYPELETYFIEQFIVDARSVSVDQIVNNTMKIRAFAYLQGQAYQAFKQYIDENNPREIAKDSFIEVTINTVLPNISASANTTQISWTETQRANDTNEIIAVDKYTAQLTFRLDMKSPDDTTIGQYNPLGFYITNITWTRNYTDD